MRRATGPPVRRLSARFSARAARVRAPKPALGRRVGDDPVRRRPAGPEELGEDRRVGGEQPLAVARVRAALLGEQEAGAGDGGLGAGLQGAGDVGALGDPAGEQQRVAVGERGADALEQLDAAGRAAHVAAGLHPLDDDRVGAGGVGGAGLADRAALVQPERRRVRRFGRPQKVTTTSAAEAASNQSRRAKGSSRLTASGRSVSRRAAASSRGDRPRAVDRDRPQAAGLGDRGRELVAAQSAAHPGLDHGGLHADALEDRHPSILRCRP